MLSATKTCAPTGSRSSRRLTSRCRSRARKIFSSVIEKVMERACAVAGVASERPVPPSRLQRSAAPLRVGQARPSFRHGASQRDRVFRACTGDDAPRRQCASCRRAWRGGMVAQAARRARRVREVSRRSRRLHGESHCRRNQFAARENSRRRWAEEASGKARGESGRPDCRDSGERADPAH